MRLTTANEISETYLLSGDTKVGANSYQKALSHAMTKTARTTFCLGLLTCVLGYLAYLLQLAHSAHSDVLIPAIIESGAERFDTVKDDAPTLTTTALVSATPRTPLQQAFPGL